MICDQIARALFDVAECPEHFAAVLKNGGRIPFRARVCSHAFEQWSEDFIACAKPLRE